MIFVSLIYGHFDILMPQYAQMNKSHAIQGYAKVVFWLHTAKTENPDSPQTYPSTSGCSEYHPYTPKHPSDTPQTPPSHLQWTQNTNRRQQAPTDTVRPTQTAPVGVRGCLGVSVGICCRLMASWVPWRCLGVSDGCLGGSGGIWVEFMEIWGAGLCLGDIWVLSPCNMEPKHYLGIALKGLTFVHLSILRHHSIKMSKYNVNKNHWVI